jgi:hypothetical protein
VEVLHEDGAPFEPRVRSQLIKGKIKSKKGVTPVIRTLDLEFPEGVAETVSVSGFLNAGTTKNAPTFKRNVRLDTRASGFWVDGDKQCVTGRSWAFAGTVPLALRECTVEETATFLGRVVVGADTQMEGGEEEGEGEEEEG